MMHSGEFSSFRQEVEKLSVSADWVKYMLSKVPKTPEAKRRVAALVQGAKRGGERQSMKLREAVEKTVPVKPSLAEKVMQTVGLSKPKTRTVYSPKHVGEARDPILQEMSRHQGIQFALQGSKAGSRPIQASPAFEAAEQARLQRMFGPPAEVVQLRPPRTAEEAATAVAA